MASQNNKPLLNRKEWQFQTPSPSASVAGAFVAADPNDVNNLAMFVNGAATQFLYHHDEDAWLQIPSGALTGTFGVGTCGALARWSNTLTATGGTTTTATTTAAITGLCIGRKVRFLTGSNAGSEVVCNGAIINIGGTSTLQFASALGSPVANTDTFVVDTGTFYVLNAGATITAGQFRSYDPLTGTWTSLSITNLPASWGTDGNMVALASGDIFASGTSSGTNTTTTLNDTSKTWTVNGLCNAYQVRITGGTGKGQIRVIATNTATALTVASAWTVTPDATSTYVIEANDDYIYLLGNAAVTMYRFSRNANAWTAMAPTTARAAAPAVGMSSVWVGKTGDSNWALESALQDGRYIYSVRGGAAVQIDRFDIAGGTAGAGAWANLAYSGAAEVFGAGSSASWSGRYVYIRKDATNRFFKFSVRGGYMEPLSTNLYPDSTAVAGQKVWVKDYDGTGVLKWLYSLQNSGVVLHRLPLF